jgi:hypothetical protein
MPEDVIPILTPITEVIATFLKKRLPEKTQEQCDQWAFYIAYDLLRARHVEGELFVVAPRKNYK